MKSYKFKNILKTRKKIIISVLLIIILIGLIVFIFPKQKTTGTVKIYDRNKILLYESANGLGKKEVVKLDVIPASMINATISAEDKDFRSHPGINIKAIGRAVYQNFTNKRIVSGASTITQQYARMIYPQLRSNRRNYFNKLREMAVALRLDAFESKEQILEGYLNNAYYGNRSYGVQSASRLYFNKDVSQLSIAESAMLAGIVSSPEKYNPNTNIDNSIEKRNHILQLMRDNNYISQEEYDLAVSEKIEIKLEADSITAPHFVNYVLSELEGLGINTDQGLEVYTTLDKYLNEKSREIAFDTITKIKEKNDVTNAAVVLIDNKSKEILVMVGGIDYFNEENAGQVNMATSLRQPGSAIKPLTYLTAFNNGLTPGVVIYDVPKEYKTRSGEGFIPNNYDGKYHGLVLPREALASSYNLPAVEMLNRVGLQSFLDTARKLGITTFKRENEYDLALTLGGGEVNLTELTNAYSTIEEGGQFTETYVINEVKDLEGKSLYRYKPVSKEQVLGDKGQSKAYLVTDILSDPLARIPGFNEKNPLVLPFEVAAKTGTTTDWHDNWTIGYTSDHSLGVWVGNNNNKPMKEITGITGAAPIWHDIFLEVYKYFGSEPPPFSQPSDIKEVEICKKSGLIPNEYCTEKYKEKFIAGTEPKEISAIHNLVRIDNRNGLLAGENCPDTYGEDKILIDYPPEVYSWAVQNENDFIPKEYSPLCPENGNPGNGNTNGAEKYNDDSQVKDNDSNSNTNTQSNYLQIISPKQNAVFLSDTNLSADNKISFEVMASSSTAKVVWNLNGRVVCISKNTPYNCLWTPVPGEYILKANTYDRSDNLLISDEKNFKVE